MKKPNFNEMLVQYGHQFTELEIAEAYKNGDYDMTVFGLERDTKIIMGQENKCCNCKYYMKVKYTNGRGGTKTHCLKLDDIISANVTIIDCNQFIPKPTLNRHE